MLNHTTGSVVRSHRWAARPPSGRRFAMRTIIATVIAVIAVAAGMLVTAAPSGAATDDPY